MCVLYLYNNALTFLQSNAYHGIWSHHFMANRWENSGNRTDFILGGSKITADNDCSHEIKTIAPWKKSYDQPRQHVKKKRHYFANKVMSKLVKAMFFPVVMYGSESWTIKKAEH